MGRVPFDVPLTGSLRRFGSPGNALFHTNPFIQIFPIPLFSELNSPLGGFVSASNRPLFFM